MDINPRHTCTFSQETLSTDCLQDVFSCMCPARLPTAIIQQVYVFLEIRYNISNQVGYTETIYDGYDWFFLFSHRFDKYGLASVDAKQVPYKYRKLCWQTVYECGRGLGKVRLDSVKL
ncbi:hypothetical protein J6590_084165 [Homalodisca vitripennis]|nr:hypothetical protein J6590_084165 [Homalodisca vitripennis]